MAALLVNRDQWQHKWPLKMKGRNSCITGFVATGIEVTMRRPLGSIKFLGLLCRGQGTSKYEISSTYMGTVLNVVKDPASGMEMGQTYSTMRGVNVLVQK